MGSAYALVAIVVVLLVVGAMMLSRLGKDRAARHEEVASAPHTLRYDVPDGQDPSAVLVALSRGGFERRTLRRSAERPAWYSAGRSVSMPGVGRGTRFVTPY